jgi:Carboxylesterase family
MTSRDILLWRVGAAAALSLALTSGAAHAQVPANIATELRRIGQIVDPACTAKLYRPLMPASDYNTYWPAGAAAPNSAVKLYPGITVNRDVKFGEHDKDLVDVFTADQVGQNKDILIYVPGGGGNKIEQQAREANAFYDNIGRWAVKNNMVGVTVQRHPGGADWAAGGRDIAAAVDFVKANAAKYGGNTNRIFIWAHSAGNGPLGVYVGHPELWPNGVQVRGAVFMSGNPVQNFAAGRGQGPGRGGPGAPGGPGAAGAPGSTCGASGGNASTEGAIAGPSGALTGRAAGAGPGAPGGGGRGNQPAIDEAEQARRNNLPGFKATKVAIMLARAELDPGVMGAMLPSDIELHDQLCTTADGRKLKDGEANCPTMFFVKGHSHMSEVFAPDSPDKTATDPILAWIKATK